MSTEIKPTCLIFAPVATRSGYGDMSRDIVRHFIEYGKLDVKVISAAWGDTPMNALDASVSKDKMILDRIVPETSITQQPDVFVHIGVPNEARPVGKFNILCTAGIETTAVSAEWVHACNQMDVVFTISQHSANTFRVSKYKHSNPQGFEQVLEVVKPIEVLHNCIDTKVFGKNAPTDPAFTKVLDAIPETFCFAFVGHWLRGEFGEDRKNVGMLIKLFLETFRQINTKTPPALILKTSTAGFSILDREQLIDKINQIKNSVKLESGQTLPNVYLLHGELTETELNTLYNHPKVKAHISFTKGEGFGRPLLEASVSGKPVIASGWSGQLDFLDAERALLVGGELKQIHPTAVWDGVLIKESGWFSVDQSQAMNAMAAAYLDYKKFKDLAYGLAVDNRKKFSYESIQKKTWELLDTYIPEFPKQMQITLPKLKKVTPIKKSE